MKLLKTIHSPEDVRKLKSEELLLLADEVRERIIDVVSETGGHLAPSLGVVELTIALHHIYQTPQDKIVWDVGHQAYAHKILTGRNERFPTIRKKDGLSGFPKRTESPYDTFDVGHAGTSISGALGMAAARDLAGGDNAVLAVIGDGSMTSGLAWEGINHAGAAGRKFTIVLNDNNMSISRNVGAMSSYLTRVITDPRYNRLKDDIWELTGKFSGVGNRIRKLVQQIESTTKSLVVPGKLFEDLGMRYLGPIDGHNLEELTTTFRAVRAMKGPVLVHVLTTKGKGYKHAEENRERFHGVGPFERSTGTAPQTNTKNALPKYSDVFGKELVEMGRKDEKVVAITAAMADGTGLNHFRDAFPDRFFDVGIAEQHAVTFAAGLATEGYRPVVAIYSSFLQRSYDQVIHDVALQNLPVIFGLDRAGLVGDDGPTHHGVFDISYLRHIPGLIVASPRDEIEMVDMMRAIHAYTEGPVAIRYPRGTGPVHKIEQRDPVKIGSAEILSEGKDVALIALGCMVQIAWDVKEELAQEGIAAAVLNVRFVKPLDDAALKNIFDASRSIVCLEDNSVKGGMGSAIMEWAQENGYSQHSFRLIGIPDSFIEQGTIPELYELAGMDRASVVRTVQNFLKR